MICPQKRKARVSERLELRKRRARDAYSDKRDQERKCRDAKESHRKKASKKRKKRRGRGAKKLFGGGGSKEGHHEDLRAGSGDHQGCGPLRLLFRFPEEIRIGGDLQGRGASEAMNQAR